MPPRWGAQNFNGAHGRAYLFEKVVNVRTAEKVERMMTTGLHVVMDIACIKAGRPRRGSRAWGSSAAHWQARRCPRARRQCGQVLGWKYERAYDETQKYKEGKFILERTLIKESPSRSDEEVVCVSYSHGVPTATVSAVRPRAATSAAS